MDQEQKHEEKDVIEIDAYKIIADDKNVAKSLLDALQRLKEVSTELEKQASEGFPFKTENGRKVAKSICLANIASEMCVLKLMIEVTRARQIMKTETDYDEDAFCDIHAFSPWLAHVQKLHGEHIQGIHAHLQQLVANVECREKEINTVFEKSLMCRVHNKKAIGRSIDGKTIICKEC